MNQLCMEAWLRQDCILGHIINSYAGVEKTPGRGRTRRVFRWEEDGVVKKGNTEAFLLHLGRRFGREVNTNHAYAIHALLRDLGEIAQSHQKHTPRSPEGPRAGKFLQPEPDEWVVREKTN